MKINWDSYRMQQQIMWNKQLQTVHFVYWYFSSNFNATHDMTHNLKKKYEKHISGCFYEIKIIISTRKRQFVSKGFSSKQNLKTIYFECDQLTNTKTCVTICILFRKKISISIDSFLGKWNVTTKCIQLFSDHFRVIHQQYKTIMYIY